MAERQREDEITEPGAGRVETAKTEPTDATDLAADVKTAATKALDSTDHKHNGWGSRTEPHHEAAIKASMGKPTDRGVPQALSDTDHATHGSWD